MTTRRTSVLAYALIISAAACFDLLGLGDADIELLITTSFSSTPGIIVPIDRAHAIIHRSDGAVAADTLLILTAPVEADTIALRVRLDVGATFVVTVNLVDPSGAVAFRVTTGGTVVSDHGPTLVSAVGLEYVGPGAHASQVTILDTDAHILTGDTVVYRAEALDSAGTLVPAAPIAWHSLHPTRGIVVQPDRGVLVGGHDRGHARIAATLLTGPADTSTLFVQPLPAQLIAELGSNQEGFGGHALPSPVVAWVRGTDAQGVRGIWIHYSVTAGSGSLSVDSALTNIDGRAPVRWILGTTDTAQTVQAATRYLPDVAVTFHATRLPTPPVLWTWVAGDTDVGANGAYGTLGVGADDTRPPARSSAVGWAGPNGALWLFGGLRFGYYNDLWRFEGDRWTWTGGSNVTNQPGSYGTPGIGSAANVPGSRHSAAGWSGPDGTAWLFGGNGPFATTPTHYADLWRFDGTLWTWVGGDSTANSAGRYGTLGVAASNNLPGAREGAAVWQSAADTVWLFGGIGLDSLGSVGRLNDLWRWDGTAWTFVHGSPLVSQQGTYGAQGVPASDNEPGARAGAALWADASGLWMFGGDGLGSSAQAGPLNDVWRFDNGAWTWISGSTTPAALGVYGQRHQSDPANHPGAREYPAVWHTEGALWLFGGHGYGGTGGAGALNDLWRFDGALWSWHSGAVTPDSGTVFGVRGSPSATTHPGARERPVVWRDAEGRLWLFGGWGRGAGGSFQSGPLNDLWRLEIHP